MEAYKLVPHIKVIIGRRMSRVIRVSRGRMLLFPVAVLARTGHGANNRWWVGVKVTKICNLADKIWVMTSHTVPRGRKIRIVVPAVCGNVIPAVAAAGQTVPDDEYTLLTVRSAWFTRWMARQTLLLLQHTGRKVVSARCAIAVAAPTL